MRQRNKIDRRSFLAGAAGVSVAAAAGTEEALHLAQAPPPPAAAIEQAPRPTAPMRSGFYTPTRFEGDVLGEQKG